MYGLGVTTKSPLQMQVTLEMKQCIGVVLELLTFEFIVIVHLTKVQNMIKPVYLHCYVSFLLAMLVLVCAFLFLELAGGHRIFD